MKISTFDTTLRDGTQGESISFSVDDKLIIAQKLDELGIDYIEGGWPGSNPKDQEFFKRATGIALHHARLTAFGSTRFAKNPVHEDRNVRALVEAGTPVVSIFGKTWDLHVKRALGITNDQNLVLISETVRYIKEHGKELVYDAEHFFDGYIANPDYALRTLEAAHKAGADVLCLCDTNGGTVTPRLAEIVAEVRSRFDGIVGIHVHNDGDLAVANTRAARSRSTPTEVSRNRTSSSAWAISWSLISRSAASVASACFMFLFRDARSSSSVRAWGSRC